MTFDIKELDRAYGRVQVQKRYFATPDDLHRFAALFAGLGVKVLKSPLGSPEGAPPLKLK